MHKTTKTQVNWTETTVTEGEHAVNVRTYHRTGSLEVSIPLMEQVAEIDTKHGGSVSSFVEVNRGIEAGVADNILGISIPAAMLTVWHAAMKEAEATYLDIAQQHADDLPF